MVSRPAQLLLALAVLASLILCAIVAGLYWATGPWLNCQRPTQALLKPGWSTRVVLSGGVERYYKLYIPQRTDPFQPAPVVFSLHGFLSNPNGQALLSGWHKLADREGFVVVYPQGTGFPQRWNAGETWGAPDLDDVQFFRDMVNDLSTVANVDPDRIYVNGFSNGGGMTVAIACLAADQVAAIGSVAGAVVAIGHCDPARAVPAMAFHGTADPIVPYEGGSMGNSVLHQAAGAASAPRYFVGAEEWVAFWAGSNGCQPQPEALPPEGDVRGVHYTGCDAGADVFFYTIEEGGHTWPGGFPIPVVGKTTRHIDATEEMWRFFEEHTLGE